jgi:hypothetical protein
VRPELAEHPGGLEQLPPEQVRGGRLVGRVRVILGERDRRVHLVRPGGDARLEPQLGERTHGAVVELCDRPWAYQLNTGTLLASAIAMPVYVGDVGFTRASPRR